jgi:hypothetical protein
MRIARCMIVLLASVSLGGQVVPIFDVSGILQIRDAPPEATPIESLGPVRLQSLEHLSVLDAPPDRSGNFVLKNVRPGRYLILPFPGRIRSFTSGTRNLAPDGFDLSASDVHPLRIVVSMKTATLSVQTNTLPNGQTNIVVLLAPADSYLTLHESCLSNRLTDSQIKFLFLTPGKYRIFVVDSQMESDVAAYAPRFPDFLKDSATPVEVSEEGETTASAAYLDSDIVKEAIRRAGPLRQ